MYAALTSLRHRVADRFSAADRGATAVEYGLLVGLIAAVIIATVILLGGQIHSLFLTITDELTGQGITAPAAP